MLGMNDPRSCNLILAFSNFIGLGVANYALRNDMYWDMLLMMCVTASNFFYQLSCTFYDLPGVYWQEHAGWLQLLNIVLLVIATFRWYFFSWKCLSINLTVDVALCAVAITCILYTDVLRRHNRTMAEKMLFTGARSLLHILAFIIFARGLASCVQ
jgi:hypothetical protein